MQKIFSQKSSVPVRVKNNFYIFTRLNGANFKNTKVYESKT